MAVLTGRMAYLLLVLVRTLCAFSPGYVHPDEWFQYGEVLAGDLMGTPSLRTWEFDPGFPCRSMASIRLFGLPIALLAWLSPTSRSPGLSLFVVQRLTFLLLSFVVDACLLTILRDFPSRVRRSALLMFASSGALFTFGMRPFSNNVEAVMLGLCLTVERKLAQSVTTTVCSRHAGRKYLHWCSFSGLLGGLIATGIFSRFTFVVFAAPIGASYLHLCFRLAKRDRQPFKRYAKQAWPAAFAFLAVCLAHIKFDTVYYNAQLSDAPHTRGLRSWYQVPVIVPINALIYNADRSNLAQHGVHPRWLHLIVNAPMVLGLGLWFFILYSLMFHSRAGKGRGGMKDESAAHRIRTIALAIIVLSLAALSVQPHQEPRFLLPLLMPASLYCSLSESWLGMSSRWRTTLIFTTWLQSVVLILLFSLTHQAGTVPMMLQWSRTFTGQRNDIDLYFWRTFMPPRHLILSPSATATANHSLVDLGSVPAHQVAFALLGRPERAKVLFAPLSAVWQARDILAPLNVTVWNAMRTVTPHVDMDHLADCAEMWQRGEGLMKSFAYGAWWVWAEGNPSPDVRATIL